MIKILEVAISFGAYLQKVKDHSKRLGKNILPWINWESRGCENRVKKDEKSWSRFVPSENVRGGRGTRGGSPQFFLL